MQRDEEATEQCDRRETSWGKRLTVLFTRLRQFRHQSGVWQLGALRWDLSTCRDASLVLGASSVLLAFWFYCLAVLSHQVLCAGCVCCLLALMLIERLQLCATSPNVCAERSIFRQKCPQDIRRRFRLADVAEKLPDGSAAQPERNIRGTLLENP